MCTAGLSCFLNFRIFIDAATLKPFVAQLAMNATKAFPHLYRCGHIEALVVWRDAGRTIAEFPHLYRCGHIEARLRRPRARPRGLISASL